MKYENPDPKQITINERGRQMRMTVFQDEPVKFDLNDLNALKAALKKESDYINKRQEERKETYIHKVDHANFYKNIAKELYRMKQYDIAIDCYYNVVKFSNAAKECTSHEVCPDQVELFELEILSRLNIALCDINLKFYERAM